MTMSTVETRSRRLDALLVERGLAPSAARARALILARDVSVDGAVATRPAARVGPDAAIELRERSRFVSRGGEKLASVLDRTGIEVAGVRCLDVGASTGGFTDCLLQRGARRVYAVETGYGVLDWKLRQDGRVVVMERQNALHVRLDDACDLVVADVGWTPLGRVVPKALDLLGPAGCCLALLKPQYEAGPDDLQGGHVLPDRVGGIVDQVVSTLRDIGDFAGIASPELDLGGRNPEWFVLVRKRP